MDINRLVLEFMDASSSPIAPIGGVASMQVSQPMPITYIKPKTPRRKTSIDLSGGAINIQKHKKDEF